jgi:DtxR family transcriptional regulator, Mn-dependent transcriptional regulator
MATSTVENYIKQIYLLQPHGAGQALVAMGELASALQVVPGTATSMIKTLADAGLVDYEPRAGVRLSSRGEKLALHVLRRHRLVELFLVQTLKMDWAEIHDEAEQLEHVISDRVLERIDALLGHPTVDPHGDVIPSAAGSVPPRHLVPLQELTTGAYGVVGRIADQADSFLQFIDQQELRPGRGLRVVERDEQGRIVRARLDHGREIALGFGAAAKIEVEV